MRVNIWYWTKLKLKAMRTPVIAIIPEENIITFLLIRVMSFPVLSTVHSFSLVALISLPKGEFCIFLMMK